MPSERRPPLSEAKTRACPDFTQIMTGVGQLPVATGLAGQMHLLQHNALVRTGKKPRCKISEPLRAPQNPQPIQRHHTPPQNPPPAPRPPPSDSITDLMKQWERLLTWATLKTLTDHSVMPLMPARQTSLRLAKRILQDYGPSLHKWLGTRT